MEVSGRADSSNMTDFVNVLQQIAQEQTACISLDLANLEFADNQIITGLTEHANAFIGQKRRIHLCNTSANVQETLERLCIEDMFCFERNCDFKCDPRGCGIATKEWDIEVFSLPANMHSCKNARKKINGIAKTVGFSACRQSDIMLAVGEAVTNAVRYGSQSDDDTFTVSCVATSDKLTVTISDSGPGFNPDSIPSFENAIMNEHGRGVHCMRAVMDEVDFDFTQGTTVRMVKYNI